MGNEEGAVRTTRREALKQLAALAAFASSAPAALAETIDGLSIEAMIERLRDDGVGVILPADSAYETARLVYDRRADKRPAIILQPASVSHVQKALLFARQAQLPIAIRGGGHGFTGRSTIDGGALIDLARMDEVVLDPARRLVRVGPGVRTLKVLAATVPHGLAPVTTSDLTIGVIGAALFAGQGHLSPRFGNMCDTVESLELVLPNGQLITVSAKDHGELFWAMRGAGDNFGVVTSMTMRVYDVPKRVTFCYIEYDGGEHAQEVIRKYRDHKWASPMPWVIGFSQLNPDSNAPRLAYLFALSGSDAETKSDLDAVADFGIPITRSVQEMDWILLHSQLSFPPGNRFYIAQRELPKFDDESIAMLLQETKKLASDPDRPAPIGGVPGAFMAFYSTGGAMGTMPRPANAYSLRGGYDFEVVAIWNDASKDRHHQAWAEAVVERFHQRAGKAVKPSVIANSIVDEQVTRAAFGADYDALVALKRKYDPKGRFGSTAIISTGDSTVRTGGT